MTESDAPEVTSHSPELNPLPSSVVNPAPATDLLAGNDAALHRLEQLRAQALEYAEKSIATSTRRYYETDLKRFEDWCATLGVPSDPILPELVSLHITELAEATVMKRQYTDRTKKQYVMVEAQQYKVSSLRRFVASLSRANYERGGGRGLGEHPAIAAVMAGLARTRLEPPEKRKPLMRDDVADLIDVMDHSHWPAGVLAARDTLMVLIGFATALRRENVARLTAGDVIVHREDGLHILVGKTKTDQEGQGATLAIPFGENTVTCVPCAWYRWASLLAAESTEDRMALVLSTPDDPALWRHVCRRAVPELPANTPVFPRVSKGGSIRFEAVSGNALYGRIKLRTEQAGFDPEHFGFHSLRSGFVTQARRKGASYREVRKQTLHHTDASVDGYDRDGTPLIDNAVTKLGL